MRYLLERLSAILEQSFILYQNNSTSTSRESPKWLGVRSAILMVVSCIFDWDLEADDRCGLYVAQLQTHLSHNSTNVLHYTERLNILESKRFLRILFEHAFDPLESADVREATLEINRTVCDILHTIFHHRLPMELLTQELFSDLFAKFGAAHIFHVCNFFRDSYPETRGSRKLGFSVLSFIPAQNHLIIGEQLHLKVVREQWDRASQESEAPDRAAIGKASIEDIME